MRLRAIAVLMLASGCEGFIKEPVGGDVDTTCDQSSFTGVRLEAALGEFTTNVYPALIEGKSQCTSCHADGSGRRFITTANAEETFYLARSGGYFKNEPGSLLARVTSTEATARMPQGGTPLPKAVIQAIARTACMVQTYEASGGTAADEQFPPELLTNYTGPAITDYDNTFLNFVQLQSKVKAVFGETWVRNGENLFQKNIGLFGGVDFTSHFVEARVATPDFLLGLDVLAPDVCGAAATAASGPFKGLTLNAPLTDTATQVTQTFEIETLPVMPTDPVVGNSTTNPAGYFCFTNCSFTTPLTLAGPGDYQIIVRAKAQNDGGGNGPKIGVQLGAVSAATPLLFSNDKAYEDKTLTLTVTAAGATTLTIEYINDYANPAVVAGGDRNVYLDSVKVVGPIGAGTGTTRATAAKSNISTLYQRMLYHAPSATELSAAYSLVQDLTAFGTTTQAWSGVCEALVRHPDFLFTLPPSFDVATDKKPLLLVAMSQQMLGRPPTDTEFTQLTKSDLPAMLDAYLKSADFKTYFFNRMQLRVESQGNAESDEAARLWTWITVNGANFEELFSGDYSVDLNFQKQPRGPEHGKTGVLTMKGYVNNKPGLPHYNYPARVLSGFMGYVFEVPPEVFDKRGTATAASTVDPTSICFNCHQLLTPLATQRLRWADDGTYRTVDDQGAPLDDSDRGMVADYPYKGQGIEAFSTKAVKKEAFVRRMINTQFKLLMGRELRHRDDERVLYKTLWDTTFANGGDMRTVLRTVALSNTFQRKP